MNRSAGTADFYIDGSYLQSSSSIIKTFADNADLNLGRFTNSAFYFTGLMDETRIQIGTVSSNWVWANWMTVASNATFATYSSETRQSPTLSVSLNGGNLLLQWPASGVGFALYTTTNLTQTANSLLAANRAVFVNGQWQISLANDALASRFYRLQAE